MRRKFFKSLGYGYAGLWIPQVAECIKNGSESPDHSRKSASKIKLSLNAWSFQDLLFKYRKGESGGMSLFDLLEFCAEQNLDAVDPTGYFFPGYPDRPDLGFINEFKKEAFHKGLAISGTGIRTDFATSDRSKRQESLELTKRWVEVAAQLGAPVLRVFAGHQATGHSWDACFTWMCEALQKCAEYGKQSGVIIGIQNHAAMLKSAAQVMRTLEWIQSDWVGAIIDTGSFLTDDPYQDIQQLLPYAVNWQVKQVLQDREGDPIDLDKLAKLLAESNYRGYVPIETLPPKESPEDYNPYESVSHFLAQFRESLARY